LVESPFLSVIVTAFNRKQFLSKALLSLTSQSIEKSKFEIISIKNFEDETIDSALQELGAISLFGSEQTIGEYLTLTIQRAKGDVILFLEDDDEFVQNRLQIIYDLFKQDPRLGYYHNDREIIDAEGNIQKDFRSEESRYIDKFGPFCVSEPIGVREANALYLSGALNYTSSIAIRRSALIPFLKYLGPINAAADYFMFYCAIMSKLKLFIDHKKLTRYRIHDANTSVFRFLDINNIRSKFLKFQARDVNTLRHILSISDQAGGSPIVARMIKHDLLTRVIDFDFVNGKTNRIQNLMDLLQYSRHPFRASLNYQTILIRRSLLFFMSPDVARRKYLVRTLLR
jgi:glycosyltransferase involved in cell wall biosynthesis